MTEATASLPARLRAYFAARFPVAAYLPLVVVGTAAAILYSRAARTASGSATRSELLGLWPAMVIGSITMLVFFFVLRVLDEHKDADVDARYRPELPVPSGLISLGELRMAAGLVLVVVGAANGALDLALLMPMAIVLLWSGLMGREFFVREWLRDRPLAYLLSHMVVMPLIFLYATSLDWLVADVPMPAAVWLFLAFSFLNGLMIEVGRKLQSPADEREGVDTYTGAWGVNTATAVWLAVIAGAAVSGALATLLVGVRSDVVMTVLAVIAALPAIRLLRQRPPGIGDQIELASGLWVLASYAVVAAASWLALT